MKTFKIVDGDISDGYHTFDELYEHRCLLFLNLCLREKENCRWRPDFEGWFVLYWESSEGQISYHLPNKLMPIAEKNFTRNDAHVYDGHTSENVRARLLDMAEAP